MSASRRPGGLGRGLASLLGEDTAPPPSELQSLPLDRLRPSPDNPRKTFDEAELADLARSIETRGLVQPIVARAKKGAGGESGAYEIVAGERRYRAAKKAGLASVPVLVIEADDKTTLEIAIVENVQRADLSAIEEARGLAELASRHGYTQDELASVVAKSRSHVANTLRLLKLPDSVQALLADGALTAGQARPLIGHAEAARLAERAAKEGLSAREVERLARTEASSENAAGPASAAGETDLIEKKLRQHLGRSVGVKGTPAKGRITLRYDSAEELDGWLRLLGTAP